VISGVPSTAWALARGDDPLEATIAAGRLLRPDESSRAQLFGAAALVHLTLSIGWALVIGGLARPRSSSRGRVVFGVACGAGIAAVDLGAAHLSTNPRMAAVRSLPVLPQVADHLVYGAVVAAAVPAGSRSTRWRRRSS
jgi:hypothetical protein